MTQREQTRLQLLNQLLGHQMTVPEAAVVLGRSDRHTWRLLAVDDATGTVPYALFQEQEDTRGYFLLLQGVIQRRGIPLGVYTNRHAAFQLRTPNTEEGPGVAASRFTQLGRALKELGVTHIFAHRPQAKGRVERANGTFQDRPEPSADVRYRG